MEGIVYKERAVFCICLWMDQTVRAITITKFIAEEIL